MTDISREEFDRMLVERHGAEVQQKLASATVGIAGLGGLGSNAAVALVRAGVGKLVMADFDRVEASNLNRQNYSACQLGLDKVAATASNLKAINPYVEIIENSVKLDSENICDVFAHCPIVAECFDAAEQKRMLIETILTKTEETIVVGASGLAGFGRSNEIKTKKITERFFMAGDDVSGIERGLSLFAPRVIIAAGHQANMILELLLKDN